MTAEKPNWIKCPKCKGFIPDTWKTHKKCGWSEGGTGEGPSFPTPNPAQVVTPTASQAGAPKPSELPGRDRQIARMNALTNAVNFSLPEKMNREAVLKLAAEFEEWIFR